MLPTRSVLYAEMLPSKQIGVTATRTDGEMFDEADPILRLHRSFDERSDHPTSRATIDQHSLSPLLHLSATCSRFPIGHTPAGRRSLTFGMYWEVFET